MALGLFLGLSAPGYGLWGLAWLALIPAFLWAKAVPAAKQRFWGGFCLGACFQALYCLWFFDLHPLTWLGFDELSSRLITLAGWLLIGLEGGLLGGLFFSIGFLPRKRWQRLLLLPILWVSLFALLQTTPLALPWGLLEYTQSGLWPMLWIAGEIGSSGITLLLILHGIGWAEYWSLKPRVPQSAWLGIFVLPGIVATLNVFEPYFQTQPAYPMPVAVVQANLPIELIRSGRLTPKIIDPAYLAPVRHANLAAGTLVLFPEEGVVPGWTSLDRPLQNPFFASLQRLANQKHVYIAVGISALTTDHTMYNSIALISPHQSSQFYHKRRLVPFGEFTPYNLGDELNKLLSQFQVDYSAPYASGKAGNLLTSPPAKLGGLLCFELIDGAYAQNYKQQQADLLINLSNLGWFHQNPLIEAQFLAIGQMRAAETGIPLVIASNTGISAILSDSGQILKRTVPSKWMKNTPSGTQSELITYPLKQKP